MPKRNGTRKRRAEIDRFRSAGFDAVAEAGELLLKRANSKGRISVKGESINLVTDVDRASERLIMKKIRREFPDHGFVAEESGGSRTGEITWFLDPIDGTTNYIHGFPFFAVSLALCVKGVFTLAFVFDPLRKELYFAEKNKGASLNGREIKVSSTKRLGNALVATGFAYNTRKEHRTNIRNFISVLKSARAVRRAGSAALDLCYVACGRLDAFWEMDLSPWDTAAGYLIVEEAGGKVTTFKNYPFDPYKKEILASNGKIHKSFFGLLSTK